MHSSASNQTLRLHDSAGELFFKFLWCHYDVLSVPNVHQELIAELNENEANPPVCVGVMQTIGDLAEIGGSDIGVQSVIEQLMPIILEMLQALSNYAKREVAYH